MSPLKLGSPSRPKFRRSASLPATAVYSDSPPPKNKAPEALLSVEWEESARAQLEIQALASSTLQAAVTGCFYITPTAQNAEPPNPGGQSPPSPVSPLPAFWDPGLNGTIHSPQKQDYARGVESALLQIPKSDLVPGGQYSVMWWDSRNSERLVRGRIEKFLFLDALSLANRLRELSSSEPAFIEGGPHHLSNLVDILWTMACNASEKGTVLPSLESGYCPICLDEMGRTSCYNPFHAKGFPDWWQELREYWDGVFEQAREDGRNVDCMFFCGKQGCLNPVACIFR
jgi:hypothetical protein